MQISTIHEVLFIIKSSDYSGIRQVLLPTIYRDEVTNPTEKFYLMKLMLVLASNIASALASCSLFWLPMDWSSVPKYKLCLGLTTAV